MWQKSQNLTEIFKKIKRLIMHYTGLGGKMLNFYCKDTNVEHYNGGIKKLKVSFQGGSNNLY